jgi:hypothetical protein
MQEERQKGRKITLQIDGNASSMAANLPAASDWTTAWNISTFTLHRAAAYVANESDQQRLDGINKDLRSLLEKKINTSQLMKVKNVTMDMIFDPVNRLDVNLTAAEAFAIGLIDEVKDITKADIKANAEMYEVFMMSKVPAQQQPPELLPAPQSKLTMQNLQELKEKFPAIFAEAVAEGQRQERDRVGAWMVFVDVDPKAVSEGVKKGENLSQTAMADFTRKQVSAEVLKAAEDKGAAPVTTTPVASTTAEADLEASLKEAREYAKSLIS